MKNHFRGLQFLIALAISFFVLGCGSNFLIPPESIRTIEEFVVENNEFQQLLVASPDGGYALPPIEVLEPGANRVGIKLDASKTPGILVREFVAGNPGPWINATITFVEDIAHNGFVDISSDAESYQFRFVDVKKADLLFLFTESIVLEAEQIGPVAEEPVGTFVAPTVNRSVTMMGAVNVTRAQWGARATRATTTHSPNRITIHHTATPNNDTLSMPARVRQMQNYHMDTLRWADIGYHFLIGQDGLVYEGRAAHLVGSHTSGHNTNNIGITFIGNFHTMNPPASMMNAGARILRGVAINYAIAINRTNIRGHREYSATVCPGDLLFARMGELVNLASTGTLRGVIHHSGSTLNPVAGALVRLNTGAQTTTDSGGNYSFTLTPGTYTITASRTGFSTVDISRTVTSGATTWGSINLTVIPPDGILRGVIYHSGNTNNRVAGAVIRLNTGAQTTTDSTGNYSFSIAPGTYTVTVSATGFITQSISRAVTSGATIWGSVNLTRL